MREYHVRFRERFGVKVLFGSKYRRQAIYKDIKADVGQILGSQCVRNGIEIIEVECISDHIHMLVRFPPKYSVLEIVGHLKSLLMVFEKYANLKYKYGNWHFWCRGYCIDTAGKNTVAIKSIFKIRANQQTFFETTPVVLTRVYLSIKEISRRVIFRAENSSIQLYA